MALPIVVLLVIFLLVGASTGHAGRSRDAYFVADRAGSPLAISGSLLATVVGGSATIGAAGLAYGRGLTGAWWTLVGAVGLAVVGLVVASRVRAFNAYTLPDLARRMYGPRAGLAVALLTVVAWTGVVSGQLVAAAHVLSIAGFGSTTLWTTLFTSVLVAYAVIGGQRAVIRTDVLQAVIIVVGLTATLIRVVHVSGGFDSWVASMPPGALDFPVSETFSGSQLGVMLVLVGSVYLVGPDIYTRLLSARDGKTARVSALAAAAAVIPVALVVAGLGISARMLAPGLAPEEALPWLAQHALPPSVAFLLLLGLLAALMSSADSTLLGQASVLANDVVAQLVPLREQRVVTLAKVALVAFAALSLLLALSFRGVIASLMFAYSIFTSGVVGPVLLGLLGGRHRPSESHALAGICVGGLCGLLGAVPGLEVPLKAHLPLIGLGLSVLIPVVWSLASSLRSTRT